MTSTVKLDVSYDQEEIEIEETQSNTNVSALEQGINEDDQKTLDNLAGDKIKPSNPKGTVDIK